MRTVLRRLAALLALAAACLALAAPLAATALPRAAPSNDPGSALQWGLGAIGAPDAWRVATGRGTTIAIVDSGVALSHEDLQGGKIVGAISCLDTNGDPAACTSGGQDDDGHGTHVAGIAAATTGNGIGVAGVAPDASLLVVKVLRHGCDALGTDCTASGTGDDVSAGIRYAADHGADVINLSLGNATQAVLGASFSDALEYAWARGAIPVVAAGNSFVLPSGFSNQHAVVVGALNRAGDRASYSSGVGQAMWALSAPGGESDDQDSCNHDPAGILSTFWTTDAPDNAYACLAGTSMAAPHVSGALAVLRSSGLTSQQAVDRVLATAHDLGSPGADGTFGAGALDLAAAVAAGPPTPPPSTTTTQPEGTTPASSTAASSEPTPGTDAGTSTSSSSAVPTSTLPGRPTPSSVPPVVALPASTTTTAAPRVAIGTRGAADDGLPAGPVSVAALLCAGVGSASGWFLVRGASWARRTPF